MLGTFEKKKKMFCPRWSVVVRQWMSCTPTHGVFPEVKGRGWTTAAKGGAEFPPEWAGLCQTASFCRFTSSEERKGKRE